MLATGMNVSVISASMLQQAKQKTDSAQMCFNKGDYKTARKLTEESQQLSMPEKEAELMVKNYNMLIAIDSATNNFQMAFKHQKEKEKITSELYSEKKEKILQEMRDRYDTDELQKQIAEAEYKNIEIDTKIKRRNQIVLLLTGFVILLCGMGLIQTYRYRQKKLYIKKLSSENEENIIHLSMLLRQVDEYSNESQQLIQTKATLEKSNLVKDKLLSVISHDLRSPMSSLQALLNLFNTNNIARKDLVDFFGKLLSRVENTSTMLENLLHWSQYQLSGLEPIFENVDMQQVIDDSINFYRMQAEQKHIVIDNSLKTSVHVHADVEMLKIILRNLISNALKFTYIGGVITIKALTKEGFVIVSVKDTGMGISPENQAKMFAMANFTTPGTEKEKGTGLGLMLCKDFVEHNQGKIWLDSKVGVGSTFYFSVPLAEE